MNDISYLQIASETIITFCPSSSYTSFRKKQLSHLTFLTM